MSFCCLGRLTRQPPFVGSDVGHENVEWALGQFVVELPITTDTDAGARCPSEEAVVITRAAAEAGTPRTEGEAGDDPGELAEIVEKGEAFARLANTVFARDEIVEAGNDDHVVALACPARKGEAGAAD
jgi:hypothetical protein